MSVFPAPSPLRGGLGRGFSEHPPNLLHHTPDPFIQRLIPKPNHAKSPRCESSSSASIVLFALLLDMLRTVKFDDQAMREANEVNDVRTDRGQPCPQGGGSRKGKEQG